MRAFALPPVDQGAAAFFGHFKTARGWAAVIAVVNLLGIAYGFYYYLPQFARTPWWLWPFVPDSPLAVLWAELALLAYWAGRPSRALDALAFVGNVQVGLWTVYVLVAYAPAFRTYEMTLNTILLAAHAAMALLALIFVKGLRDDAPRRRTAVLGGIGIAFAYYAVNDALDYFGPDFIGRGCGLRPYTVPCDAAMEPLLALVTTTLTVVTVGALLVVTRPKRAARTNAGRM